MSWIVLALTLLMSGCDLITGANSAQEYEGVYESGFEVSSFRRCDTDERWWVTGGSDIDARYREVARSDYEPVFVRITGITTPTGEFGHMGAYRREIEITRISEIRALRSGECPGR